MDLTAEQKREILYLYCVRELPTPDVARLVNLSRWSVEAFLKKHNIINRRREIRQEEREHYLRDCVENGMSIADIATTLDVEPSGIYHDMKKYNIPYKEKTAEHEKADLIAMLREGLSNADIAQRLNISVSGVKYRINKYHIDSAAERAYGKKED